MNRRIWGSCRKARISLQKLALRLTISIWPKGWFSAVDFDLGQRRLASAHYVIGISHALTGQATQGKAKRRRETLNIHIHPTWCSPSGEDSLKRSWPHMRIQRLFWHSKAEPDLEMGVQSHSSPRKKVTGQSLANSEAIWESEIQLAMVSTRPRLSALRFR